jgi:PAS domain S-box-containing protein
MKKAPVKHELQKSDDRFRTLLESNMIGMALSDLDVNGKILEANDAFLKIIGYTKKDLKEGRVTWSNITPPKYEKSDDKKVRELVKHGTIIPFEKGYIHKKGHIVPVLVGAMHVNLGPVRSICFAVDISEQKQQEKRKDEFIGTVSHELKTPLAVLKMQTSLLGDDIKNGTSTAELIEAVGELDQQIDKLTAIISHHLNLARLRDEQTPARTTLFNVGKSLRKVVQDFSLVTKRKIVFKGEDKECFLRGNELSISEVFTNLISNALRYSSEDTPVWVSIKKEWKSVRICIQDFGRGIEKKELKKIFERYYRVDHADGPTAGSSGLGLHICNEIIQQHHGRIEVVSKVGKGSTFCCILPLASL